MTAKPRRLRILHLQSSFGPGDNAVRSVQLINAFGRGCEHSIVSAIPDAMAAARGIDPGIAVDLAVDFPPLQGRATPGRLQRLARAMLGYDLVLTYGYDAMDAAMAHTLFGGHFSLPPLVHHEDEAKSLKPLQNWYRRIGLGRAAALVVPSRRLETLAMDYWHQPRWRVKRIIPGIRTAAYTVKPRRDALPRVIKRKGELWLGTFAELTAAHRLTRLVRAFAALPEPWQLVILGEGPQRDAVRDEALQLDLGHRVHLPGSVAEPGKVIGLFDLFALSAEVEQPALALVEAMAAGLALVATDVGETAALLAPENRPFVVAASDETAFAATLRTLAEAPALRASVGAANRALARTKYDEAAMVSAYRKVYGAVLGRESFP